MSVEKIAAELGQVLALLDLAALVQALELIDQAESTFGLRHPRLSGEDAESDEVWQRLVAAGVPEKFKPMSIDHVEMKVALRMVKSGSRDVELAINNRPCRGLWSCRVLLPILLPEGYTLTVYGPHYQGTFTGGKKWSS
ncbi:DddA-like double-stranded DNA deaminase toxin [Actinokineospora sp.]|uniref:DddA-like double-stranded DNA deaminase toxin n=1 Tax=Actinokineospora sp. TaxID=1872133 RepID=UPI004037B9E7